MAVIFIFSASFVFSLEYAPLERDAFADFGSPTPTNNSLVDLLTSVFNFGIAAAVALALIMIIRGGIIKMTTDSWQGQDEAKSIIENAIYGLGLALISYLVLYTINPCLVMFTDKGACNNKLLFLPKSNNTPLTNAGVTGRTVDTARLHNSLLLQNIRVSSSNNCYDNALGCTDLVDLPQGAINGLNSLSTAGADIIITGGAESAGHGSHGPNIANVDIAYNQSVIDALNRNGLTAQMHFGDTATNGTRNIYVCEAGTVVIPCTSATTNDHIHVQFQDIVSSGH